MRKEYGYNIVGRGNAKQRIALLFILAGQAGEHFSETDKVVSDAATGYNESYGYEDHNDACAFAQCHALPENSDAENDGSDGLKCAEDGCRS